MVRQTKHRAGRLGTSLTVAVIALGGTTGAAAAPRNFQLKGKNELSGGIGFGAGMSTWSPSGFKWFNDYSRELSKLVWFNTQFNVLVGGSEYWGCKVDKNGREYDCKGYSWGGNALELGVGVKLKWRLRHVPLQFHAKVGGGLNFLWYRSAFGVGFGFRGGFGVRYFFVPTFGVGAELAIPTVGPAFWNNNVGAQVYAAVDFSTGVEWRF